MLRRRRPLLRAAAVGGGVAHSPLAREVGDRVLASALARDARQAFETLGDRVINSPDVEHLAERIIASRATAAAMHELLRSSALWDLVDEIASSEAVTT